MSGYYVHPETEEGRKNLFTNYAHSSIIKSFAGFSTALGLPVLPKLEFGYDYTIIYLSTREEGRLSS